MIHQLLNITRPLYVLDTETTGLYKGRIVELGFEMWTAAGMEKAWRSLINPGIPIPAKVTEIHHITDAMMKGCRICGRAPDEHPFDNPDALIPDVVPASCFEFKPIPFFQQLAAKLAVAFSNCDFAGKNVRFDLQVVADEMKLAGVVWDYAKARIVDADRLEALGEPRSLSHLHKKYTGKEHDEAHGALSDARATTTVVVHQLQAFEHLPRDLDALHELQWPCRIDVEGKFRFVDGVPCIQFGKHRGSPMQEIPNAYYDFILKGDFSEEVKAIARAAKLGNYPEISDGAAAASDLPVL